MRISRGYDTCQCGARKTTRAAVCQECRSARGEVNEEPVGGLDYFTRNGRYGIVAVSGYTQALGTGQGVYGTTLAVLDGNDQWREVERVRVRGPERARAERAKLIAWIKEREWAERITTRKGAA